ncbi:Asp-tRNA(Asn)/Glu-tRNA(Gln) amidotransferase subunit GatB [Legionella nagasakiensis]|uniref:Asp-tRNA(Asn)/Glu-tRNA(Gln) amidotransferase subunit GatB n=1 Tax=Legionella nagasakiensis TaxID=535290 RepID=UPI001054191F|nr:Asp-tRNA(Asn)/Glu-tRNA(Gln) amidotransferase subunit GatB [Legionella nagasakiensis]
MSWETVIGLEVHAQLKTQSKLFSATATRYGAPPNSQASFIDAGLPGVLPVLNREAIQMAIRFGLAIEAEINNFSYFERKNYFYPDLPKGYQISQYRRPIIQHGHLAVLVPDGSEKMIIIERAHLEEDAGKSLHDVKHEYTGIDLNRAGTPLLEIVTAPCLSSAKEAVAYLRTLHQLLRFLDICDGNMQEGSFRCDVNISLRPKGSATLGTRTELKNLNSFRFIEKAIVHEQFRHQDLLETGQPITQETRLYSPETDSTHSMRSKESEKDYRYFPDPDLLPIVINEHNLQMIKQTMPELPKSIRLRLQNNHNLLQDDIDFLISSPALVTFFDAVIGKTKASAKTLVNWLKGSYSAALKETGGSFNHPPVSANQLACLLDHLENHIISAKIAKTIFSQLMVEDTTVDDIIAREGYQQIGDQAVLDEIIRNIIEQYPQQAADYQAGKTKLLAFFVGKIMQETQGKANPAHVNELLRQYLK